MRRHLEPRREVGPELEPVHPTIRVALGHLLVEHATAGRHPLDVPRPDDTAVAQAIAMFHGSRQHVHDRLDASVRMPGKPAADNPPAGRRESHRAGETGRTRSGPQTRTHDADGHPRLRAWAWPWRAS